jgi:hypothetical protein
MIPRRLLVLLACLSFPVSLWAQDGHSLGIGGTTAAAPMGIFGVYWNPSMIAVPDGSRSGWSVASGFSAFDTNNAGQPVIHFNPDDALQSSQDPIKRYQQYLGLFVARYLTAAGGLVYDQDLNYLASQSSLQFFHDRDNDQIGIGEAYNLNYQKTTQQVSSLVLSYGMPVPLGNIPLLTIGGSLKYHDGLQYEQDTLTGTYTQSQTTGSTYTKTTSNSGLGLSIDGGFFAKFTDALQVGMMFENIRSSFTWNATQVNYQLDPKTGAESPIPGSATSLNVSAPFPYAVKLGMAFTPPDKNIALEGEVDWSQHQARWHFGMERYYPEAHLAVRFGTFADQISNQQMWCFGIGYFSPVVNIDASFLTRSIPDLEDSISLGGALDAVVLF